MIENGSWKRSLGAVKRGLLLTGILIATTFTLSARTLTSADGNRTIEAEVIDYRPSSDTVVFRFKGKGVRQTAKASAFSEEDRAYFLEFLKEKTMGEALRVNAFEEEKRVKEGGGLYTFDRQDSFFRVSVRNAGEFDFDSLTAKYDIYVQRFDGQGDKEIEVVSGEATLEPIPRNMDALFETQSVKITLDCKTSSSCPTCVKTASAVKRERVLGLRVRIENGEGEQVTEFHSSNSVRTIAEKEDERSSG